MILSTTTVVNFGCTNAKQNLSYSHPLGAGVVHKSEKFVSLKRHFSGPVKQKSISVRSGQVRFHCS